jgi:hypothetical protein
MFSRIGMMRALDRHIERVIGTSRKEHHWGRRKLARDRWQQHHALTSVVGNASVMSRRDPLW